MDGIINIYKEKGYTSHDVVAKLRGILRMRRIGHTGTLDPDAEGVLPVCLGTATRLCDMLTEKKKAYRATVCFGIATDTEDMSGTVLKELPLSFTEEQLKEACVKFTGSYDQIPPMYSAIKIEGKKLYELARQGKVVEREARPVTVHSITVEHVELNEEQLVKEAVLTVSCGKGTYIRSLCRDIGEALGTCACMKDLMRTRSGVFTVEESIRLDEVEQYRDRGEVEAHIVTVEDVFAECGELIMLPDWDKLLLNGNPFRNDTCTVPVPEGKAAEFPKNWLRAYTSEHKFLGIYEKKGAKYVPVKMFL